VQWNFIDVLG